MNSGIYVIQNLVNGKYYVGSAVRLQKRWKYHRWSLLKNRHGNRHLQNAWDKYGEQSFVFNVLEYVEPERLLDRETFWIQLLRATDRDYGYNIAFIAGSNLGTKRTDETKQKIGQKHRGKKLSQEQIELLRRVNLGRKLTDEAKAKIAVASRGRRHSESAKEKIRQAAYGNTRALGFKHNNEFKEKCRLNNLGNKNALGCKRSSEERKRLRQFNLGKKWSLGCKRSEESKEKMRQAALKREEKRRGWTHSPEVRDKISRALKGKKQSPVSIENMTKAQRKRAELLKEMNMVPVSFKGHKHSEESKAKMSQTRKGRKHTEETKEKMRQSQLRRLELKKKGLGPSLDPNEPTPHSNTEIHPAPESPELPLDQLDTIHQEDDPHHLTSQ